MMGGGMGFGGGMMNPGGLGSGPMGGLDSFGMMGGTQNIIVHALFSMCTLASLSSASRQLGLHVFLSGLACFIVRMAALLVCSLETWREARERLRECCVAGGMDGSAPFDMGGGGGYGGGDMMMMSRRPPRPPPLHNHNAARLVAPGDDGGASLCACCIACAPL